MSLVALDVDLRDLVWLVRNIGTASILEPKLVVRGEERRADAVGVAAEISVWFEASDSTPNTGRKFGVIDSGETAEFVAERYVEPTVWAVTYSAVLTCTSGDTWGKRITVANTHDPGASTTVGRVADAQT